MNSLELKNIDKFYGSNHVVKNLNLDIKDGEFLTILGPSGCGKTTTLRMIGGFELPNSGLITLNGTDITFLPPYKREVNTVFQNYALFPNMTVAENVAFGLKQKKMLKKAIDFHVAEMLEMVQMGSFGNRKPQELSGGQQQRVAIARAVANDPQILLLDEPLGALDLKLRKQMQSELKSLHKELKKTFIYVTHDQEEALTMSDRIAVMNGGTLEQVSDNQELYYRPKTKFVADFVGEANLIDGLYVGNDTFKIADNLVPVLSKNEVIGQRYSLFIRPENVQLNPSTGKISGIIKEIIFVGITRRYSIELYENTYITATETTMNPSNFERGQTVFMDWDTSKTILF